MPSNGDGEDLLLDLLMAVAISSGDILSLLNSEVGLAGVGIHAGWAKFRGSA